MTATGATATDHPVRTVGIEAARAELGDLADAAQHRDQITYLTRHGKPVAAIVPMLCADAVVRSDRAWHPPAVDRLALHILSTLDRDPDPAVARVLAHALYAVGQGTEYHLAAEDDPVAALREHCRELVERSMEWLEARTARERGEVLPADGRFVAALGSMADAEALAGALAAAGFEGRARGAYVSFGAAGYCWLAARTRGDGWRIDRCGWLWVRDVPVEIRRVDPTQ